MKKIAGITCGIIAICLVFLSRSNPEHSTQYGVAILLLPIIGYPALLSLFRKLRSTDAD